MRADIEAEYVDYVRARWGWLHRTAYVLCGDADRAEDLAQATMIALYGRWRRMGAVDNVDAYVRRMLVRRFLDEKRLAWSRIVLTSRTPDTPAPAPEGGDEAELVHAALRRLPPGQRAALVLRFMVDLSVRETAAAMGCSEGNVKAQTARGLTALRPLLASVGGRGGFSGATGVDRPSGINSPDRVSGPGAVDRPTGVNSPSRTDRPPGAARPNETAGPTGIAGLSGIAGPSGKEAEHA